jgi:hypothetical protein
MSRRAHRERFRRGGSARGGRDHQRQIWMGTFLSM